MMDWINDAAIPVPHIYPKELKSGSQKEIYPPMNSRTPLFTIAKM